MPVILNREFEHIEQCLKNIPEKGFLVLNKFKSEPKFISLENIISSDLLSEDYFLTEEQKRELDNQFDRYISYAKMTGAYHNSENARIELHGPALKDKLKPSDFTKLDYDSYLNKINSYLTIWNKEGWSCLVEGFRVLHQIVFELMENESAELRDYYFLDAELINNARLYEVNWYDYFFSVISTLKDSETIYIWSLGND